MAGAGGARRRAATFAMAALWVVGPVGSASAGAVAAPVADPRARADTVELLVVSERTWSPAVAVTLSFAGGHGDDPPGAEGAAWLLGMVLARTANANLAETGATAEIEVDATRTWVTLLAALDDWAAAYGILARALMEDPIDPAVAGAARAELAAQLRFQRDAPVRAFELEARRTLLGPGHRAARPRMGYPSSVTGTTVATLEAARARVYRRDGAGVAVTGAVAPTEAAAAVGARRAMAARAGDAWVVEGAPLRPGAAGPAWETGGHRPVIDEITNSWIVAAYPFPGASARATYEFIAHVLDDQLVTDPPAPGLIGRRVEIRELPDGPVLLVTVAAESQAAASWEQRVADAVNRLSANPLSQATLNRHHRSFRSARALDLSDPAREGRRLLTEARAVGRLSGMAAGLELPGREELQRAVAGLGEPRVLVYGLGGPSF